MSQSTYDVLLISDFRFPGGTASAVAEEIRANAAAGYRTALVHLEAANLTYPFPTNPKIKRLIEAGLADLFYADEPVEARLTVVHSPHVLRGLPQRSLAVRTERRLLVVHHPPFDAHREPYYDLAAVRLHAEELLGGEVQWAPVGPLVREQFAHLPMSPPMFDHDWYNVVDVSQWRVTRTHRGDRFPVLGRHSRPDWRKWPDRREDILAAYPDDPRFRVRILGSAPFLLEVLGLYPRNWEVLPFDAESPERFLAGLDFFVYYHHSSWVEAFGCTIAEALASGAVAILPPHLAPLFGDAAVYAELAAVKDCVLRYHLDHPAYAEQSERGQAAVAARFSHTAHVARLRSLIGEPRPLAVAVGAAVAPRVQSHAADGRQRRRVLFLSSDGVGMGHLSRLLAIARRCRPPLQPVFVTMSQAARVVHDMGFLVEYLPYHGYLGCDIYRWNKYLRNELNELIAFYQAAVVICDFNSPFQGVIDAAADNPDIWFVWCRRGMWRPGAGLKFIERERHFQVVLEPQDLAGVVDAGPTIRSRDRTRVVPPIRLLDHAEMLPCELARRELGLDLDRPAIIIQLGSGNNYDYNAVQRLALQHLLAHSDVQVVVAEWLMADRPLALPPGVVNLRRFPLARWFHAFDAAISAVGYNSYHELIFAGLPTLFVPNENPSQDDQLARARYADRHGLGLCVRAHEIYRLIPALDRLLDPSERQAIATRCAALDVRNGAADAAAMVEELSYVRRADCSRTA
jgi:Glycosyltransferase family 28 C-terminal domain